MHKMDKAREGVRADASIRPYRWVLQSDTLYICCGEVWGVGYAEIEAIAAGKHYRRRHI